MELFPALSNIIAGLAIVLGLSLAVWWAIGLYWIPKGDVVEFPEEEDLPGSRHEMTRGLPPVLTVFYIFTAVTLILYVLYVALQGVTY